MKELLEEKELLEKRLSNINKEIEKEQSRIELNKTINLKTKEVQNLLTGDLLIKVHYLEKENKILITEYFEEEYITFPYYDEEYEIILYQQTFKTLYDTITMLNKMIKEAKILKNKLNLIKVLRTEYKYEYDFHNFEINHIMQITHKDSILAALPEPFDTELYTFICFNENNKLDLAITTKIKYSHDIDITTTKLIDNIKFNKRYTDYSDQGHKIDTFRCTINNVKLEDVHKTLQHIKTITFSNSSLVKLASNYSIKY